MKGRELIERLHDEVVVGDGAMGTMLQARGVPWNANFDLLNLTHPEVVSAIHAAYAGAGAQVVETNTFGGNRNKLGRVGEADKVREANLAGARLAREAVPDRVYVAGAMGPFGRVDAEAGEVTGGEMEAAFREQAEALLEGGVDLLILETFSDLGELKTALTVVKSLDTEVPVICQMAFADRLRTMGGVDAIRAVADLERMGADVIGGNCGSGPAGLIRVIERAGGTTKGLLSAFPNASFPEYVDGRYLYLAEPGYLAESAARMAASGANLIGGCCGTTPDHIRLISERIGRRRPAIRGVSPYVPPRRRRVLRKVSPPSIPNFLDRAGKPPLTIVELKPPRGTGFEGVLKWAGRLAEAGADLFSLVENSLAVVLMSPFAHGHIVQQETGVPVIIHCTCRDRNVMGQQSELLGAHALGIRAILALTGDPASMGEEMGSSSVYDTNSQGLIELIAAMNRGLNRAGNPIQGATSFLIGGAFNPNSARMEPQVRRLEKKVARGAQFAMTQPVFDQTILDEMYRRTVYLNIPVFAGIMPLVSGKNAEFLHNEVPGIRIPDTVRRRMAEAGPRGTEEGLAVAAELIDGAAGTAPGFYLMPQLNKYDMALELVKHVKAKAFTARGAEETQRERKGKSEKSMS